jgi:hypothetical protein
MRCSWFWTIIFLLTLALVVPASAQDEPKPKPACIPAEMAISEINKQIIVVRHVELDEEQTKRVIKWYNELPPVSDEKWDYVVMFQTTAGLGLLFGNNKLVCDGMKIRRDQVQSLLDAIAGGEGT